MPTRPNTTIATDILLLVTSADRAASRLCRIHAGLLLDREDVRQDLLLDLLTRLKSFDPARSTLPAFAAVCFQHRIARLAVSARRDQRCRHSLSLDAVVPGTDGSNLIDRLTEADGYSAWLGQPTDGYAALERRLDVDRAMTALSSDALTLCAVLVQDERNPAVAAGLSRSTFYRRVHEVRCQMLAAGVCPEHGTDNPAAG